MLQRKGCHYLTRITAFDLTSKIHKSVNAATKIDYYAKMRVLFIDELGYTYHKKDDTDSIFQIISKRSEILSTIVTTNLLPKEWGSSSAARRPRPYLTD